MSCDTDFLPRFLVELKMPFIAGLNLRCFLSKLNSSFVSLRLDRSIIFGDLAFLETCSVDNRSFSIVSKSPSLLHWLSISLIFDLCLGCVIMSWILGRFYITGARHLLISSNVSIFSDCLVSPELLILL